MLFVLNGYFIDNYPCISLIDTVMLARSRCADLERANHLQIKDYEGKNELSFPNVVFLAVGYIFLVIFVTNLVSCSYTDTRRLCQHVERLQTNQFCFWFNICFHIHICISLFFILSSLTCGNRKEAAVSSLTLSNQHLDYRRAASRSRKLVQAPLSSHLTSTFLPFTI